MSGWFKFESDAPDHPKTRRLARALGLSKRETVGLLAMFWASVCRFAPDGNLRDLSAEDIEDLAGWDGEPGALLPALVGAALIDETAEGLQVHGWMARAEAYRRAQSRQRARLSRDSHATSVPQRRGEERRGEDRRREEKRGEEGAPALGVRPTQTLQSTGLTLCFAVLLSNNCGFSLCFTRFPFALLPAPMFHGRGCFGRHCFTVASNERHRSPLTSR